MFKIVWPCDFGDWKRKIKKMLSPSSLNASELFFFFFFPKENHELVICAPVTSQWLWFPSWLQKWPCLGPGAGRAEPEPVRWWLDAARAEVPAPPLGRRQSAPVPPFLAGAE